jgi:hypothetical protein
MNQENVGGTTISTAEVAKAQAPKKASKPKVEKPKAKTVKVNASKAKAFVEKLRLGTIGRMTAELIVQGKMSNDEILKAVKAKHKGETTSACIAWYRSKARKEGAIS